MDTTAEDLSSERSSSASNSSSNVEQSNFQQQRREYRDDLTRDDDRYSSHLDDNMPIALDCKSKDYTLQRSDVYESSSVDEPSLSISPFRKEQSSTTPATYSTFCRELREMKQKNLHATLERAIGQGNAKELEIIKAYGLDHRAKDFARIGSIALDRLRAAPLHGENPPTTLEPEDLKSLQHLQSRNSLPSQADHHAAAALTFERLRHVHPLFQTTAAAISNDSSQTTGPFHHPHHLHPQQQHAITQLQHISSQQQQHHHHHHQQQHSHHQQAKSFTIDAILGLRGGAGGQREKQRHASYRKHQGQDGSAKNLTGGSCSNGNNNTNNSNQSGGKLKRVRTIFTAEQLERLEGEFSRQQYMVGPERLYLAHALRLTEAQVKVWFQNRRIKWRKVNHEQQSQRLHDLHQGSTGIITSERDDSNDNSPEW